MKLETIKKDKKKNIIIGSMIVLSVVGCLTLTTTRAKYRSVQSLKLASGTVRLNSYDFKIVAMKQSEDGINYTDITTMPDSGYIINEEKSYCTPDNKTQVKGKLKTVNGIHGMYDLNKNDKCYIWFDRDQQLASDMILANVKKIEYAYKGESIPNFASVGTGSEAEANNGIYKVADGMYNGYSYYWRGAATMNHVIFAKLCWRIVRINGNKTLRLIYNGTPTGNTCTGNGATTNSVVTGSTNNERYYATSDGKYGNSSYVGWTYTLNSQRPSGNIIDSNAKTQTEKWYKTNITDKGYSEQVVIGKFCNDRNTGAKYSGWSGTWSTTWSATGMQFAYAGVDGLWNKHTPTLSCPAEDVYNLAVGAISADEVQFAGGKNENNASYYLYNGQNYWTMSPMYWDSGIYAIVFYVSQVGTLNTGGVNGTFFLRPVINLRSDVTFNDGSDGTQNNPYIVQ